MNRRFSARSAVEPFHAMDVLAQANRLKSEGHPVISLAVGQPGAQVPLVVREAAAKAAIGSHLGYTDALGRRQTRQAIADHYRDRYGVEVSADRIAVTTGSSAGFSLAFIALAEAGGRVAITKPGYPAYRNIIRALSMECVEIETLSENGHVLDVDALMAAHREKPIDILLLASPANPTGAAMDQNQIRSIVAACRDAGISFLSDEIYHGLRYDGSDVTALSIDDDIVVINSFSKYYCMTGWRIGWMVLPHAMVRTVERLAQSLYISAPDLSQLAAPHAFEAMSELEEIKAGYAANRRVLMDRLPEIGFTFAAPPDGAFYAWCDVSKHTNDSMDFAKRMLSGIHVACAPGIDFDPENGHRFMRLSYAGTQSDIVTALDRITDWLK